MNINIDSGLKRVTINGDENRVIEFNPEDIVFVEKFYGLIKSFEEKGEEFKQRAEEINVNKELDSYGIPVNTPETISLVLEFCAYLRKEIDQVFGPGTSEKAFGNTQTLNMFEQFFNGITPYIQGARTEKVGQYKKRS